MRIGLGFDVHALSQTDCCCWAVRIPFELGLAGHSDADVLLHAIADALLGRRGVISGTISLIPVQPGPVCPA